MSLPTVTRPPLQLEEVNSMSEADFVNTFGSLFEHSAWIARESFSSLPCASRDDLLAKLTSTLRRSSLEKQVALIQAHPDLAGRLAQQGKLTNDSTREQSSAGLDRLSPAEARLFESYNEEYKTRFGFPFVICARLNDKKTILLAFQQRLQLSRLDEIQTALGEIEKIAALRLTSLMEA